MLYHNSGGVLHNLDMWINLAIKCYCALLWWSEVPERTIGARVQDWKNWQNVWGIGSTGSVRDADRTDSEASGTHPATSEVDILFYTSGHRRHGRDSVDMTGTQSYVRDADRTDSEASWTHPTSSEVDIFFTRRDTAGMAGTMSTWLGPSHTSGSTPICPASS